MHNAEHKRHRHYQHLPTKGDQKYSFLSFSVFLAPFVLNLFGGLKKWLKREKWGWRPNRTTLMFLVKGTQIKKGLFLSRPIAPSSHYPCSPKRPSPWCSLNSFHRSHSTTSATLAAVSEGNFTVFQAQQRLHSISIFFFSILASRELAKTGQGERLRKMSSWATKQKTKSAMWHRQTKQRRRSKVSHCQGVAVHDELVSADGSQNLMRVASLTRQRTSFSPDLCGRRPSVPQSIRDEQTKGTKKPSEAKSWTPTSLPFNHPHSLLKLSFQTERVFATAWPEYFPRAGGDGRRGWTAGAICKAPHKRTVS